MKYTCTCTYIYTGPQEEFCPVTSDTMTLSTRLSSSLFTPVLFFLKEKIHQNKRAVQAHSQRLFCLDRDWPAHLFHAMVIVVSMFSVGYYEERIHYNLVPFDKQTLCGLVLHNNYSTLFWTRQTHSSSSSDEIHWTQGVIPHHVCGLV